MRDAFVQELESIAEVDPSVFLITGDLGFGVLDNFANKFPSQFLNSGVAEQSMMSLASGLADDGYKVFVYSIANFPTLRCIEQIRNDVCYPNRNVNVVSVGAGLSYGSLGYSHHAIEDIAMIRPLPNIEILSPFDPIEAKRLTRYAFECSNPTYIRLGKNGERNLLAESELYSQTGLKELMNQGDVAFLATGSILEEVLSAAHELSEIQIPIGVYALSNLNKISAEDLEKLAKFKHVIAVEEHSVKGGLFSLLSENFSSHEHRPMIHGIGITNPVQLVAGSHDFLRSLHGLSRELLVKKVLTLRQ